MCATGLPPSPLLPPPPLCHHCAVVAPAVVLPAAPPSRPARCSCSHRPAPLPRTRGGWVEGGVSAHVRCELSARTHLHCAARRPPPMPSSRPPRRLTVTPAAFGTATTAAAVAVAPFTVKLTGTHRGDEQACKSKHSALCFSWHASSMQQQAMAGGEARKGQEGTGSAEESSKRPSFRTMGRGCNQSEQKEGQDKGKRGGHR